MRKLSLIILLLLMTLSVSADRGGFYYKSFAVDAVVHTNNEWDVTETIDVVFTEPRHGIYRYIPDTYWLNWPTEKGDAALSLFKYSASIWCIDVPDHEYQTDYEDINKIIRIGSEYETIEGEHRYVVKYKFSYPDDRLRYKDYLFHTILGTDFAEPIEHFSFNIAFDKHLPATVANDLQVFSGKFGEKDSNTKVKITVAGDTIKGMADNIEPYHGVTLYCDLPEGWYEDVDTLDGSTMTNSLGISFVLIVLIIALAITRRHQHVTKQIEFYPPEGISSAEVGTIIDDQVDNIDIASLIPWFASKGYLKIKEIASSGLLGKKTVLELHKANPLPSDAPQYQRDFMSALFGKKSVVRLDDLSEEPEKMNDVNTKLKDVFKGKKGSDDDKTLTYTSYHAWWYLPLVLVSTFALMVSSKVSFFELETLVAVLPVWTAPFVCTILLSDFLRRRDKMQETWERWTVAIILLILYIGGFLLLDYLFVGNDSFMSREMLAALFIGCVVASRLEGRFVKDSPYRVRMMGKLMGLKEFIQTAEKPRLESLLEDDPDYFYKVLPYALVFGLSDKWAEQFENITMKRPDWYDSHSLNTFALTHSMNNLCSSASSAITTISHDSTSTSSVSSGGGFSGGGGGGGGGGSW